MCFLCSQSLGLIPIQILSKSAGNISTEVWTDLHLAIWAYFHVYIICDIQLFCIAPFRSLHSKIQLEKNNFSQKVKELK